MSNRRIKKSATIEDINANLVFPCYCCQNNKNGDLRENSSTCWKNCEYDRGPQGKSNFRPFLALNETWTEWSDDVPMMVVRVDCVDVQTEEIAKKLDALTGKVNVLDTMLMIHNHEHQLTHEPPYLKSPEAIGPAILNPNSPFNHPTDFNPNGSNGRICDCKDMIPRPDLKEAIIAIDRVIEKAKAVQYSDTNGPQRIYLAVRESLKRARLEALKLMGVEVKE